MTNSIGVQLKSVETENLIWLIYLFIIGANFISNYFVEKYLYAMDEKYRKIVRNINILVLTIALLIYIYSLYIRVNDLQKESLLYQKLILLANFTFLIGGIIFLAVEIYKSNNPEIGII